MSILLDFKSLYSLSDVYIHYFSFRFTVISIFTFLFFVIVSDYIATTYVALLLYTITIVIVSDYIATTYVALLLYTITIASNLEKYALSTLL